MKTKLFLMFIVLSYFCPVFGQRNQTQKVAILETVDKESVVPYGVKLMIRSKLAYAITKTSGYEGYDRVDISSIMSEQEFQRTGLVNETQIKRLGEMTGADYILIAEVAKLDNTHILIISKILNVETAKLEKVSDIQTTTNSEDMEKACRELAVRLLGIQRGKNITTSSPNNKKSSSRDFIETAVGLNMRMIYIEGGKFMLETPKDRRGKNSVKLASYYIGECEITQKQWERIMGTSIQQQARNHSIDNRSIDPDTPIYYVSWEDAWEFCQELSRITGKKYCLPTVAQWEYAARGGKKDEGTKYSGSWSIDAVAWYADNSNYYAHPVKTKRPNGLGLYDMSGNVWEWCADGSDSYRSLRGGSWSGNDRHCCVSYQHGATPTIRYDDIGFRVVVIP